MIRRIREWLLSLTGMLVAVVVLSSFLIASYEFDTWPWADRRPLHERFEFRTVRRTTLEPIQSAPGRVESSRRTVIRCELENLAGSGLTGGGASTLIWIAPEGTHVRRGDVLARLDGATYEELLRQQSIVVEQAKASHLQARLDYEIAQLAVREYLEGTVQETVQGMEGSIALARSDVSRAQERLEWTQKMNQKGYASIAQIVTDRQTVATLDLALKRQVGTYDLFLKYTLPKTEKTLRAAVTTAQTSMNNEYVRLQRQLERYELLKKQVERCTIRAPHDGVLFYHKGGGRGGPNSQNAQIEEGMSVRQKQQLFYLPDLSEMEIQLALNESVVDRIRPGLRTRCRFEALPQLELSGQVVSVNQIPVQQGDRGEDVRYFQGEVKLDHPGAGHKPGMTARVEIILPPRRDVLSVPHRAVGTDQGRKVCWVPQGDQLVRREVRLGQATPELVEILEGLVEGEQVALDPPGRTGRPQSLSGFLEKDWVVPASPPSAGAGAAPRSRAFDPTSSGAPDRRKNRRKAADGKAGPRRRTPPQG
jgi:HlyD family secretion protein